MDERDCRILMALSRSPFDSLESIGRTVGTSGTAVKARLDRLRDAEILQGFACGPSARVLGKHERLAVFAHEPQELDLASILKVDEVAWVARGYPAAAVAMLYRDDPTAPLPPELLKAAGRSPDAVVVPRDPRGQEARGPISPLDWRVIEAVMHDPRATVRAVAARAGLSARTTRDRRDALLEGGDLVVFPAVDATREEGAIFYSAYVGAGRVEDLQGLRLQNAHRVATHHQPPGAFLVGYVRTYAEAHIVEEKMRSTAGVVDVTFSVPQGTIVARERLAAWTRAEISKWDKARRVPKMI